MPRELGVKLAKELMRAAAGAAQANAGLSRDEAVIGAALELAAAARLQPRPSVPGHPRSPDVASRAFGAELARGLITYAGAQGEDGRLIVMGAAKYLAGKTEYAIAPPFGRGGSSGDFN